ncbi:hypothetical protein BHS06_34410 [Myxococcus xanthus]|nr:hypothetical protein BHS06_34410 [Myxococcus xanthus]
MATLGLFAACAVEPATAGEPATSDEAVSQSWAALEVPRGLDFGGAFGRLNNGVLSPNPATGAASCPEGYTQTQVLGTWGRDWDVHICQRPSQEGSPPLYDFGGMWGAVNAQPVVNPITHATQCPDGYTAQHLLGTYKQDHALHLCYRPHVPGVPSGYRFGGAHGFVNAAATQNPATGAASCPEGFEQTQVLGTHNVDYPLYFCMARASHWDFGGFIGTLEGSETALNPVTNAATCPDGYLKTQVLGTSDFDQPLYLCTRPNWDGTEPELDFGGMWGVVNHNAVNNPYTNTQACPAGFQSQRVLGTLGQDYNLHACYRPHVPGTGPTLPFGGMWGHVAGSQVPNPVTAIASCPKGFTPKQVFGTSGTDAALYLCEPRSDVLDFGGAFGRHNNGVLSPNPATGAASCPEGYTQTQVLGTWGRDWDVHICQRPSREGSAPLYDFGGMWGYVNAQQVVNPITHAARCPAGYTAQQLLGTYNQDYGLHLCYRPHVPGRIPENRFGGIHGHVNQLPVANPATGTTACPPGAVETQVLGTHDVDHPVHYCMTRAPKWDFGGVFGYLNGGSPVFNPATSAPSCPEGYLQTQVLGTSTMDAPLFLCSRPTWDNAEPELDFGGMWGVVNGAPVNNPYTNEQSCPTGFSPLRILGTPGQDSNLHVCYRHHAPGTVPPYPFGGMWGHVNDAPVSNPTTSTASCPTGFIPRQVLGTANIDHPLYFCELPSKSLDFGGAFGFVNNGTLSPNPATGAASCPQGYTKTQAYGSHGRDWSVHFCHRPSLPGAAPLYDFGGMWGYVNNTLVRNPITNSASCPAGYTDQQLLGTDRVDHALHVCYRPHTANTPETARFGGMYGTVQTAPVPNPATATTECPSGFEKTQVLGTHNVDHPLSFCMARAPGWDFGGFIGSINGGETVPNPVTGTATCPDGYIQTQVSGTDSVDWPLSLCARPNWGDTEPALDFGGLWGYVNHNTVNNPYTNTQACPAGFQSQRVLGTLGQDYNLHACYRPHVPGQPSPYAFAGLWGHVNGVQAPNPTTGAVSCPRGFAPTQVSGAQGTDNPLYICEPLQSKFAPRLRFDGSARGYPMSAQVFYDAAIVNPQQGIIQNTDASTLGTGTIPTYYQLIECGQQVRIKYWWFYGYQSACDEVGNGTHHGDWEDVTVTLSEDKSTIAAVTFSMHGKRYTRLASRGGFQVEDGTHPVVYVGKNSHAAHYKQGGSGGLDNCLPWEEYRNNSTGTHLDSWMNLVNLDTDAEPWMAADRIGNFVWGYNGVSTHPTRSGPSCRMNAAHWSFTVPTWWHSQCKTGDRDDGTSCHSACRPGYTDMGLTCTNWSITSLHTYRQHIYGYDYTLPTSDRGLMIGEPH